MLFSPLEQFELGILQGIFIYTDTIFFDLSFTNLSFFFIFYFFLIVKFIYFGTNEHVFSNPLQKGFEKITSFILSLLHENLS